MTNDRVPHGVQLRTTALRNARILYAGELVVKSILIHGRAIAAVTGDSIDDERVDETIDLEGRIVLPGCIDGHVHFREPGEGHKGDWATESLAAAAGGVTSVLDMPNNRPPCTTDEILNWKRSRASKASRVNFGFFFGVIEDNIDEIRAVRNIPGLKVYLNQTTGGLCISNAAFLARVFREPRRLVVHAEGARFEESIALASSAGRQQLHLTHISSSSEVEMLRRAPLAQVTADVTPHHLLFTGDDTRVVGGRLDMKPPLGTTRDREALWEAVARGDISAFATDHAPHRADEKATHPWPMGIPGVELMLPLLLNECHTGRIDLRRLIEMTSLNPARIFGMQRKGRIEPGYDADLVVVELDRAQVVTEQHARTKHKWTPYLGRKLVGWPVMTFVLGRMVWSLLPGQQGDSEAVGDEITFDVEDVFASDGAGAKS